MRTIRNFTLCILHFAFVFAAALSGFAKTFDVDISTGRPAASNEAYYHGETIEFRAVRGRSVVTNIEYASIYYQTNGMGDVWWRTDGLTFHPTNDVGAASYRFFMEGRDDLGRDWHANGLLRLLPSPGFTPNEITMPVATLDFAAVDVLNPPWTDPDYSTSNAALVATIEATAPAPGNYAVVSNAAVYAAITNALQDAAIAGKLDNTTDTMSGSLTVHKSLTVGSRGGLSVGFYSVAEGINITASGSPSHAEGGDTYATGDYSHAEGRDTAAYGSVSHAEGGNTSAAGDYSHAEGRDTAAQGSASHAEGCETEAKNDYEHAQGRRNLSHKASVNFGHSGNTLASIGFGDEFEESPEYKNAVETMQDGKTYIYGLGNYDGTNPTTATDLATEVSGKQDNLPYPTNAIPYAAISGKPSLATVATSGSYNDLSNKPTIPTVPTNVSAFNNDAGYLTGYTESDPTIKAWAKANTKPTYTASEVGAATAEDVYRIVAGTNVILVVTNYNSAVHAPAMKLQHLDPESGQYVTYWDEQRRHGMTLTNAMDYTDAAAAAELSRADAAYAPRAWSGTTSALGAEAPAGVTWISTPETVIAGGYEYEKVITTAGAVWVLTSNGLSTGATTNSYFRVAASDGTELFSIEKTDSYLVGVNATGITKSGNTVTIPVNVVAPSHPYIRATTNLVNAVWTKEDENGFTCPFASVSWSGSSGAYVATVTCSQPQAFFYFEFMQQGTAKIKNSAKTEMTGGIIFNGTTYMPTVNGNKLEFVAQ